MYKNAKSKPKTGYCKRTVF